MKKSSLLEILKRCREIISLAMNHTDERSRHLTDHIYHIITFAAITACRLLYKYDAHLENTMVADVDELVLQLIFWLRSIGLPCHAAHLLGDVLAVEHAKLRPKNSYSSQNMLPYQSQRDSQQFERQTDLFVSSYEPNLLSQTQTIPFNQGDFAYTDPGWSGMLDLTSDPSLWPQWDAFTHNMDDMSNYAHSS